MNFKYLFEIQAGLDRHIEDEHPRQEGEDRLAKKILALQVELGELANEWRGFKFWKINQNPVTEIENLCPSCSNGVYTDPWGNSETCEECNGENVLGVRNPLLEEYVDCLHFILSIGLELGIRPDDINIEGDLTGDTTTETFNRLFSYVSALDTYLDVNLPAAITKEDIKEAYHDIFECFTGLGELQLGFTWKQIEQAYLAKNKINHERQVNGY